MFKPNEHTQEYHSRKPNNENFLSEIKDEEFIYVGEKVISFEINDTMLNYSSELGFNVVKFPYAYNENNIYFMLHLLNIFLFKNMKLQHWKMSMTIWVKKRKNWKVIMLQMKTKALLNMVMIFEIVKLLLI